MGARQNGQGALDARAKKRLQSDELLLSSLGGSCLRMEHDRIPLWQPDTQSISIAKLVEYFTSYNYLPRIASPIVIDSAIEAGVRLLAWWSDAFAYADSYDHITGRFLGLVGGKAIEVRDANHGLVVRGDVSAAQLEKDLAEVTPTTPGALLVSGDVGSQNTDKMESQGSSKVQPRRYHATVELDPERLSEVSKIYAEVVSHLLTASLRVVRAKVNLEIEAVNDEDFPDNIVRIVGENGLALNFKQQGFEEN